MALGTWKQKSVQSETHVKGRPVSTLAFDWVYTILLFLLSAGVYMDGWSHGVFGPDQSVFSEYHLLFYTSLSMIGLWFAGNAYRYVRQGYRGLAAVPAGYSLSFLGVILFGIGGVLDLSGHALFGFETEMEALLSPTHLFLFVAWALISVGPARAAAFKRKNNLGQTSFIGLLPMLVSWTMFANVIAFAGMAYLPTMDSAWMLAEWRTVVEFQGRVLGVMGVLAESILLVGISLWLIFNFRLPWGSFSFVFVVFALLSSIVTLNFAFVPIFVIAGVLTDGLYKLLNPSVHRRLQLYSFGFLIPVLFWSVFYAYAFANNLHGGVWYTGYIWTGSIVEAGLVGLFMALLSTASQGAE